MLKRKTWRVVAELCALVMAACCWAVPVNAQMAEVKEKPPMYTYVSFWTFPREQWAAREKEDAADQKMMEQLISSGDIVAYGYDQNMIHQPDGDTHDDWFSAMSMAGVVNIVTQFYKNGSAVSPVLASATKHFDALIVSRFYNWHPGSWKDAYTHGSSYKLRPDAPEDAVEKLSKNLIAPVLEKLLAEGTIQEYDIDTEAIHTESPGTFWIFYITTKADGLDKTNKAIRETLKTYPLSGPAFDSMVDYTDHRDYLTLTNATFK